MVIAAPPRPASATSRCRCRRRFRERWIGGHCWRADCLVVRCRIPAPPAWRVPVAFKSRLFPALALDEVEPALHDDVAQFADGDGLQLAAVDEFISFCTTDIRLFKKFRKSHYIAITKWDICFMGLHALQSSRYEQRMVEFTGPSTYLKSPPTEHVHISF